MAASTCTARPAAHASAPERPQVLAQVLGDALLDETARRAAQFFRDKSDARTGLCHDRANLNGVDDYQIASIAATGYALASLAISAERGWISREEGAQRARRTLGFVLSMEHERGWMFHFVDARDGKRAWKSEASTMDTALLVLGALACGEYFRLTNPDIARDANALYARLDWSWARTNGGAQPHKQVLTHGWKPDLKARKGFLLYNYDTYSEAIALVLLGLGAARDPLPPSTWDAIGRPTQVLEGVESLAGGPLFIHQMPHGFLPLRNRRDRLGWDYWTSSSNAMKMQRLFASRSKRKTHARGFWGLNAGDGPRGYTAYGLAPSPEDGTVSPSGAIASVAFDTPEAEKIASRMKDFDARLWGRYGFAGGFNVDKNWFGPDVIGIDLGMALLAIENQRSGLIWNLMKRQPWLARAYKAAGLRVTAEAAPRKLKR